MDTEPCEGNAGSNKELTIPFVSIPAHSRLILQAAKEILIPMGLEQRGRSRTWLDDHGWWLIMVEFQPSSWSKGSYLNVGVMWLWKETDYLAFDVGHRVEAFTKYEKDEQFQPHARTLAEKAREEALKLRDQFSSIEAAADFLQSQSR